MNNIIQVKNECFNEPYCEIGNICKQLQEKEQECENWERQVFFADKQIDEMQKEIDLLKQYKKSKQASYESMQVEWNKAVSQNQDLLKQNEEWQKQVAKLKVENEELKETANKLLDERNKYLDNWGINLIYKQTLTEIKEIAEKYTKLYYADFKNALILILQKISECEAKQ